MLQTYKIIIIYYSHQNC